jgi:hypothetical protein
MNRLALAVLGVLSVMLAGCLMLPGRFDSTLDWRRDGTFHFRYTGEVVFLPLTQGAKSHAVPAAASAAPAEEQTEVFAEENCSDAHSGEPRACTADEIAAQRRAWQARKTQAPKPSDEAKAGAMMAMLGGMDPSDPRAGPAFADALRRQAGWRKVVAKGNGVFEVEYEIAGRLDHDFTFPTVEHVPMIMPFVAVTRRTDGSVRVEAPGFAPGFGNIGALGGGLPMGGGSINPMDGALKGLPKTDGVFAVTTDGVIATNNTEDGPTTSAGSQRLTWKVGIGHAAAPAALIRPN